MKGKAIIPLAIGLAVGIVAIKLFVDIVKRAKGSTAQTTMVSVVTAKTEIGSGILITNNMLTTKQIPAALAPAQKFSKPEEIQERVTSMMIPKEMPILASMLAPKGTAPGLGAKIPDGMRAVAVKVDEWVGVGGWLKPGVRVDVAAVFSMNQQGRSQTISKIILQNIEVAAIGGEKGQSPQDTGPTVARSVTLLVKPADVGKIHLASEKGKIRLAMRNSIDGQSQSIDSNSEDELLGIAKQPTTEPKAEEPKEVEPEPVRVAVAPSLRPWHVDVVNGKARERKVYRNPDSMEDATDEDSSSMGEVQAEDRPAPSARTRSVGSGSPGSHRRALPFGQGE